MTVSDTFLCFVLEYGTQITWIRRMYTRGFVFLSSGKGNKLTMRPSNTSNNTKLNNKLVGLEVVLTQEMLRTGYSTCISSFNTWQECHSVFYVFNPLHPNISIPLLHTVLSTFSKMKKYKENLFNNQELL